MHVPDLDMHLLFCLEPSGGGILFYLMVPLRPLGKKPPGVAPA